MDGVKTELYADVMGRGRCGSSDGVLYVDFADDFGLWLKQGPWDDIFDGIKGGLHTTRTSTTR